MRRSKLFALLMVIALEANEAQRAANFAINVLESDTSGRVSEAALNEIFDTFLRITEIGKASVGDLENNIRTVEEVLMTQQQTLANVAANVLEKVDETREFDARNLFADALRRTARFFAAVATIDDFERPTRSSASRANASARIAAVKRKYTQYSTLQAVAARNNSEVALILQSMANVYAENGDSFDEDLAIEYATLHATVEAFKEALVHYMVTIETANMKLISLQTDTELLKEGCTFSLPCGTFLPYEPEKDQYAPKRNGFLAGRYWNGREVYVGAGWTEDGTYTPGHLMTEVPGPGVIMEAGSQIMDNRTADYLLNHKNLVWRNHTWLKGTRFPDNTVYVNNAFFSYGIGRWLGWRGEAYIGKVMGPWGFYFAANNSLYTVRRFQLLTCK